MDAFGERFSALKLIPGEDGCFEVTLNDERRSKRGTSLRISRSSMS
jgi:hypothetical protein